MMIETQIQMMNFYSYVNMIPEKIECLEKIKLIYQNDPENKEHSKFRMAEALILNGKAHLEIECFDNAVKLYREAKEIINQVSDSERKKEELRTIKALIKKAKKVKNSKLKMK